MIKFYLALVIIFSGFYSFSQGVRRPLSSRYVGLGAYSKNHVDGFSFTSNQAALAQIKNGSAGVYGERRFLLSETNYYTGVITLPTKQGNFGVQADYFGFKDYNESQLGLAYARSLGSKLDVGIKFNYYNFRVSSYGNSSAINFELGAIAHLTEKLNAGIHIYNPVGGKLSKTDGEKLSSVYTFGLGYEASDKFFISSEIIKEEGQNVNVNVGFQYNFLKQFFIRAGTSTETASSFAGAGVSWKNFRLEISAAYHQQLGFTPGLLLLVNFKDPKD